MIRGERSQDRAPRSSPSAVAPAERLRTLGLRPRKRLSQSFLADQNIARAIVAAADLNPASDEVLEVGPGLGVLTVHLVNQARRVVAVELDVALAAALPTAIPSSLLEVVRSDILQVDPSTFFAQPFVVLANLPYHITSPALRHLLAAGPPFADRLVVMVQREVAERIAAPPGNQSALAVLVQAQAAVRVVRQVPAGAFFPPPKVDSTVLRLDPLPAERRLVPRDQLIAFEGFLHAGFAQPRKTLLNSLSQGLAWERPQVGSLLEANGVDPGRRPQTLSLLEWASLFRATRDVTEAVSS